MNINLIYNQNTILRYSSYVTLICVILIMSIKTYGISKTDSVAVLTSFVDSVLDIISALVNIVVIRIAFAPPDDNHRFGHHKIQDLSMFSQSIFFLGSGIFLSFRSVKKMLDVRGLVEIDTGLESMFLSAIINCGLVLFQTIVINKTGSKIVSLDRSHYISDILMNISTGLAIYLSKYSNVFDSIFALLVSLYMIFTSFQFLKSSVKNLLDEEFEQSEKLLIVNLLKTYKDVLGAHDFKTRKAGSKLFVQIHLEFDGSLSLEYVHNISKQISLDIKNSFNEDVEVIIDQDPFSVDKSEQYKEF